MNPGNAAAVTGLLMFSRGDIRFYSVTDFLHVSEHRAANCRFPLTAHPSGDTGLTLPTGK